VSALDEGLLDQVAPDARVVWAGQRPPFPHFRTAPELYDPESDFRLPAEDHGAFDVVYLTERDLGLVKQWPLVLDEALRLAADGGLLVLRFTQGPFASIFELKDLLRAWSGGDLALESERTWPDTPQTYLLRLRVRRTPVTPVRTVTLGVITDGRKPSSVSSFVESAVRMERPDGVEVEVVVCGPAGSVDHLTVGRDLTRLVEQPDEFTSLGWITRKKNLVVQESRGELVVVAHDRYTFATDFLTELLELGPDVSVVVCRQETVDGRRFPDWVTIGAAWAFAGVGMLPYGDWSPEGYVNGGVMIARREVLVEHPWNELLFWNQAEDVELSRRMRAGGVVPRLARRVRVHTVLSRQDQMSAFEVLPFRPDAYPRPGNGARYEIGREVRLDGPGVLGVASAAGVGLPSGWSPQRDGGPVWVGDGDPEFAVSPQVPEGGTREMRLVLRLGGRPLPGSVVGLRINGRRTDLDPGAPADRPSAPWPADLLPDLHTARIELLTVGSGVPIQLEGVLVDVLDDDRLPAGRRLPWGGARDELPPCSAAGWGHLEDWGRWSVGRRASLRVPTTVVEDDLEVVVDLQAVLPRDTPEQRVAVLAGGVPLDIWALRHAMDIEQRRVVVPRRLAPGGWLELEFVVGSPVVPAEAGINADDWRPLGIGLAGLTVRPAGRS
jgi:hypothetical protein